MQQCLDSDRIECLACTVFCIQSFSCDAYQKTRLESCGCRLQAVSCLLSQRVRCPTDRKGSEDIHASRYLFVLE